MVVGIIIDLDTEKYLLENVDELNKNEGTHIKVLSFDEEVEVTGANIEIPEDELQYLFYLGYSYGKSAPMDESK